MSKLGQTKIQSNKEQRLFHYLRYCNYLGKDQATVGKKEGLDLGIGVSGGV